MRILILNWKDRAHPLAGGAEVYTEHIAERLVELGHEVTLFVAHVDGRPERELIDGYEVIRRGSRLRVYSEAKRYWRHHGPGRFDVVIDVCNTRPFLTPRYVESAPVVALIFQVAREVWRYEMPLPVAVVGRYVLKPWWLRSYRAVQVMTISESSAASLEPYGVNASTVLSIGADRSDRPDVRSATSPTVVFLGRLSSNKRPDHAIAGFGLLRRSMPDARLWIMGDGPIREELQVDSPPGVEVLGHVPWSERQERLAAAHVLVATSVREGWGLNVSEAAAVGTPSIGYAVDGLRDSVQASGGYLVDPDPESLGRALIEFFAGRITLEPKISTVDWSVVGDEVETVLAAAIDRPVGNGRR